MLWIFLSVYKCILTKSHLPWLCTLVTSPQFDRHLLGRWKCSGGIRMYIIPLTLPPALWQKFLAQVKVRGASISAHERWPYQCPIFDISEIITLKLSRTLTEHSFTDRSALYRIPLELVKNRKLHNEKVFFWTFKRFFQDFTNSKPPLLAAVNFCHWRIWSIFHPSPQILIFDYFSG